MRILFFATFIFSFHVALNAYINSTFIATALGENLVGIVYGLAALLSLFGLTYAPSILRKIGAKRSVLATLLTAATALVLLRITQTPSFVLPLFILYLSMNTLTFFVFDILVEHFSKKTNVGHMRGAYLFATNIAWVFAPLIAGRLVTTGGMPLLYGIGVLLMLVVATAIVFGLQKYHDVSYERKSLNETFLLLREQPGIRRVIILNFALQFFYAWMVIYTPLYLTETIGLSWESTGIIFTIMLLPFVLIQYPLGALVDKGIPMHKLMAIGFGISAIATGLLAWTTTPAVLVWAVLLFFTRVGASIIEASAEFYFFKHVSDKDTHFLRLFRDMSPLAYLIAPPLASIVLYFSTEKTLFIILAVFFIAIIPYTLRISYEKTNTQ